MPPPSANATIYATDESVLILGGADFQALVPPYLKLAAGTDGVIGPDRWTLTSAIVDFAAQGVRPNMVIQLLGPQPPWQGSGDLLAVDAVNGHSVTLRRAGQPAGRGQPAAPGPTYGVEFLCTSLQSLIEEACYGVEEKFDIDAAVPGRTADDLYSQRPFRQVVTYRVLWLQYLNASHGDKDGDFMQKSQFYQQAYLTALAEATVRWGATGQAQQPTRAGRTRVSR